VQGLLLEARLAGWINMRLVEFVSVVPQRLDTIGSCRPRRSPLPGTFLHKRTRTLPGRWPSNARSQASAPRTIPGYRESSIRCPNPAGVTFPVFFCILILLKSRLIVIPLDVSAPLLVRKPPREALAGPPIPYQVSLVLTRQNRLTGLHRLRSWRTDSLGLQVFVG